MDEQQRQPTPSRPFNPVTPVGMTFREYHASRIEVDTWWWHAQDLYEFVGAKSANEKRVIRRHLEQLRGHGAGQDKQGRWLIAEVVARTYFAPWHDAAVLARARRDASTGRTSDGTRPPARTFRPRVVAGTV
jgi:hypothetical protein